MSIPEYAIFRRARIPVFAMSFGVENRGMGRQWKAGQLKKDTMDETWTQAPNLSKFADIFARTCSLMGQCRFPLYFSKNKEEERFDIWRRIDEERMKRNEWYFVGPQGEQTSLRPTMTSFRRIAARNQAKARLRYLRARRVASKGDDEEVWGADSFLEELSEGESLPPDHSEFPLTLSGALSLPLASSDPRLTFPSLKRSRDTLESGSTKERKKDDGVPPEQGRVAVPRHPKNAANSEDYGVFAVNEAECRLALLPEDIQNAIGFLTAGWPTYQTLCVRDPRFPYFMNNRKLPDWKKWIPRIRTGRQAGILFPGPCKQRAMSGRIRRICVPRCWRATNWFTVFQLVL